MGLLSNIKKMFTGKEDARDDKQPSQSPVDQHSEDEDVSTMNSQDYFWDILITAQQDANKVLGENDRNSHRSYWYIDIKQLAVYENIITKWPNEKRINFMMYCMALAKHSQELVPQKQLYTIYGLYNNFADSLYAEKCEFTASQVQQMFDLFLVDYKYNYYNWDVRPYNKLLQHLEKQYANKPLDMEMSAVLTLVCKSLYTIKQQYDTKHIQRFLLRLDSFLDPLRLSLENKDIKPIYLQGKDNCNTFFNASINALDPQEQNAVFSLMYLSQKISGSKPNKKALQESKQILEQWGREEAKTFILSFMEYAITMPTTRIEHNVNQPQYAYYTEHFIQSGNVELLKGFIWLLSFYEDAAVIDMLGSFAERCFKKIPGVGQCSTLLGNACIYALYQSGTLAGIGQLSKLRLKIKLPSTQKVIEKHLLLCAAAHGMSVDEMEDLTIDAYGMTDGQIQYDCGDYFCRLHLIGAGNCKQEWYKKEGTVFKSIPATVKNTHAELVKQIKLAQKKIEQSSAAQKERLDRVYKTNRKWTYEKFYTNYIQHGLMGVLARQLIWTFTSNNITVSAIWLNGQWQSATGQTMTIPQNAEVQLWHPVWDSIADITAWRDYIMQHEIQQPFKQAYREVYLLTEAEINTQNYSNRMAAHLLKQHQFDKLAKSRGWTYTLKGDFDNGANDYTEIQLPQYSITAQYWVYEVSDRDQTSPSGIFNYITTDQVRFYSTNDSLPMDLIEVPPILFSEIMRDVDLFVGVASIGNDPNWVDNGQLGNRYDTYWQTYSFGELSATAKNRKEILERILPKLKIRDLVTIKDKYLIVKGNIRTYKIHLGSTNILMEPNDQYLCIVPDSSKKQSEKIFIPFEGDAGLSIILSKALLLSEDDKIKDTTIVSQIQRN